MYIHNVTLEGFKSYGLRAQFEGLDPVLTLITGPRNSGKTNFLDSIAFVLGFNDRQFEYSAAKELLFGHRQVGISKAIVSLGLKSLDQSQSPFTVTREIGLDRSALYMVNESAVLTEEGVKHPYVRITKEDVTKALSSMTTSDLTLLVKDFVFGSGTRANLQVEVDSIERELSMNVDSEIRHLLEVQTMYDVRRNEDARLLRLERYLIALEFQNSKEASDAASHDMSEAVLRIEKIDYDKRILEKEVIKLKETLSKTEYEELQEKCDNLHRQIQAERAKQSDLQRMLIDKEVAHTKLKHEVQQYVVSQQRDLDDYEFSTKAKEFEDLSSLFASPAKKKQKLMPNEQVRIESSIEAMGSSQRQQQLEEIAKFEDEVAQHLEKEKASLGISDSVLNGLKDEVREVEAGIQRLERERKDWQRQADVFMSKASKLRLQLLHNSEKTKVKNQDLNAAKEKKQELQKESTRLSDKIETMIKNYNWIEGEKDRFGVSGGEFDFESVNFDNAKKEYEELLSKKAGREPTTVEDVSEQLKLLQQEGKQLEERATKLKARIKKIDLEEGPKVFNAVNGRFQRIVAALLPGVDAKLEVPPNAANILEGLQVAVSRGADRQSLSQMPVPEGSVVALSLLLGLSLQKEREAKLYLLDLAHTVFESESPSTSSFPDPGLFERFRAMISELFPKSQFIVTALFEESPNNVDATFLTQPQPTTVVRRLMKQ